LNRFDDASATTEIRLVVTSRCQESQALTHSNAMTQADISTIADWISDDTVRRFNMFAPGNFVHLDKKG
jgi:hypothetical protein